MDRSIIFKQDGFYAGHPHIDWQPDGRLAVGMRVQPFGYHAPVGGFLTFVSDDEGHTWTETDDQKISYNWPASSHREKLDRWCGVMRDGSWVCAGSIGEVEWSSGRREEAEKMGVNIREHPQKKDVLMVGGFQMFSQRSLDMGRTWDRHEYTIPGFQSINSFGGPRACLMEGGTLLIPTYGSDSNGNSHNYVWKSSDNGLTWGLFPTGIPQFGLDPNETTIVEVHTGRLLALSRTEKTVSGYLVERWSDDGGHTWSHVVQTDIRGFPAHLLKLRDGRIVCCYGYRWEPMGVRAVVSEDGGKTWDTHGETVLESRGSTQGSLGMYREGVYGGSDVGYPVSVQLSDDTVYTVYYTTSEDGITHVAATRWTP